MVQRGGAYAGYGIITILYAGALLHGLYDIPAVNYDGYRVYANLPPCGAMRGHGSVDTRHAFECLLDRMARELGLDPFAVRRANLLQAPTRTLNDLTVNSYGLAECLDRVERASGWRERIGKLPPGKGLGMACSHYVSGAAKPIHCTGEPHAVVNVRLDFDGGVTALTGAADIGQGSSTMVAIAVAETLDISLDRVRVIAADSAVTPKDNGAYSSRITFMVGNAAIDAAKKLKAILVAAAAAQARGAPGRYRVRRRDFPRRQRRAIEPALRRRRCRGAGRRGAITVKGTFTCPPESRAASTGAAPLAPPWASVTPPRSSRSASTRQPVCHRRQGMGRAGLRPCYQPARGRRTNPGIGLDGHGTSACARRPAISTACRRMPACSNIACRPSRNSRRSKSHIVESHDPYGPFGAKEASEGALAGFPPALVNAIANAIGIDLDELPVTPDRVMEALIQRRRQARLASTEGRIMTAPLAEFRLAQPSTVKEAIAACLNHPGSRFVAGGTDLLVNMRRGISSPDLLVDLSGIDELTEIKTDDSGVTIGAGVTIAALARDTAIASQYRALAQAAAAIAGPGHRIMGTVGGNLCLDTRCIYYNQSEWWRSANAYCLKNRGDTCHVAPQGQRCHAAFSGDLAPALLVLGAEIDIAGAQGQRRIP